MLRQNPAHHVLIDFQAEGVRNLLSNAGTAEVWIEALDFEDGGNQCLGRLTLTEHPPLGYVIRLGRCHGLILVSELVHAISQTTPPHRSTSITEASTLLLAALELTLSIGILPRGLHRLSFPSIVKDQSSRVPQNSL